jgi:hypothetical protein
MTLGIEFLRLHAFKVVGLHDKALSSGRGLGEGKSTQEKTYLYPLIPAFSLREKGRMF